METKAPIIALVDDDKIFQITASRTLKAAQLSDKILQFDNGEEALDFLRDHARESETLPDYIFLDINMPFVDGWMFLDDYAHLKTNLSKPIEIYMVSSSIDPRDMDRARQHADVREYIIKPVTREKFIELLSAAA
ncbi:response regulator [Parachryseolinea silvisoli]|jgi:two-component system, chemotaxis family, chemotaxis protein CheY|uniref:response regulator n=1 Tax=Parachryseolinea silvisoli TaxID=2873601 RepID=UPI0022659755|nr:response regulator [Parachryseolinea silvisoli]MCD9017872.1 response regulator [Parachryseolinea silvisoli]